MARSCTICRRPDAGSINARLTEGHSARSVALEMGISEDALQRHARSHASRMPESPPPSLMSGDPLDELVEALRPRALAGGDAQFAHQYRLALEAQSNARHAAPQKTDLATDPEWIALRGKLLTALEPFPKARQAVAAAIAGLDR